MPASGRIQLISGGSLARDNEYYLIADCGSKGVANVASAVLDSAGFMLQRLKLSKTAVGSHLFMKFGLLPNPASVVAKLNALAHEIPVQGDSGLVKNEFVSIFHESVEPFEPHDTKLALNSSHQPPYLRMLEHCLSADTLDFPSVFIDIVKRPYVSDLPGYGVRCAAIGPLAHVQQWKERFLEIYNRPEIKYKKWFID